MRSGFVGAEVENRGRVHARCGSFPDHHAAFRSAWYRSRMHENEVASTRRSGYRKSRITLWVFAILFLLLSAWLIPGSIWGTSEDSSLAGGGVYFISIPVLVVALLLLWFAIRAQRRTGAGRT